MTQMPDQATLAAATPKCNGRSMRNGHWTDCHRLLRWNHAYAVWICSAHGRVLTQQHAVDRLELAARTTTSGPQ